jgi:hypothetical protein
MKKILFSIVLIAITTICWGQVSFDSFAVQTDFIEFFDDGDLELTLSKEDIYVYKDLFNNAVIKCQDDNSFVFRAIDAANIGLDTTAQAVIDTFAIIMENRN